jgi:hypothetical protein
MMEKLEKAKGLLDRAAQLGLHVEFRSGLNVALFRLEKTAPVDPEVITSMMEQLAKYLPEIRDISQRRAVAALGKTLVGRRIWSKEHGEGTLIGASEDGNLDISIGAEMRRSDQDDVRRTQRTITSNAESLLIVLDEDRVDASSSAGDEQRSEQPKRGFFERLRHGARED